MVYATRAAFCRPANLDRSRRHAPQPFRQDPGDPRPGELRARARARPARGGCGRVPPQLLPRQPRAARRALPGDPRRGGGHRAAGRCRRRPAGAQAQGRPLPGGSGRADGRPGVSARSRSGPGRCQPRRLAPPGGLCRAAAGHRAAARRRPGAPRGGTGRRGSCRDEGGGRRPAVRPQGRQRTAGGPAYHRPDREGPAGPALRARSRRSTGSPSASCSVPRT